MIEEPSEFNDPVAAFMMKNELLPLGGKMSQYKCRDFRATFARAPLPLAHRFIQFLERQRAGVSRFAADEETKKLVSAAGWSPGLCRSTNFAYRMQPVAKETCRRPVVGLQLGLRLPVRCPKTRFIVPMDTEPYRAANHQLGCVLAGVYECMRRD